MYFNDLQISPVLPNFWAFDIIRILSTGAQNFCLNIVFILNAWIDIQWEHFWIGSMLDPFSLSYPCKVWSCRDIAARYEHFGISLQGMNMPGYPCKVWSCRDIPTRYEHVGISLQGMIMSGYPCKVWTCRDIPAWY